MTAPIGWPSEVPPPTVPGWEQAAVPWLLDLCPSEHRAHQILARHPVVLARVALEHVRAGLAALRTGYARARVDFEKVLDQPQVEAVVAFYEAEGRRLRKAEAGVALIDQALRGKKFAPKL